MKTILIRGLLVLCCLHSCRVVAQTTAVPWWEKYSGTEAQGEHVLGFWTFSEEGDAFIRDSSSHAHRATVRGGIWNAAGRFDGCLEGSAGYPVVDKSHGLHITRSSVLSPPGAFTVEMWIKAKEEKDFARESRPVLLDMKYVPGNHTGLMFSLTAADSGGKRQMVTQIGLGTHSEHWYSQPFDLPPGEWRHVAFTYDAQGTVGFFVDGGAMGSETKAGLGPMAPAVRDMAIGDRLGSNYNGFPGFVDEVRITSGTREFRPVAFEPEVARVVVLRGQEGVVLRGEVVNQTGQPLEEVAVTIVKPNSVPQSAIFRSVPAGGRLPVQFSLDASLKPGEYDLQFTTRLAKWGLHDSGYEGQAVLPFVIVPRPLPQRMPVVMWGVYGVEAVEQEIPRLKEIGFTHCMGLRADYQRIWEGGATALPASPKDIRRGREMLDTALENDLKIIVGTSPGRWLRTADAGKPFRRVDRQGKIDERHDVSGLFEPVKQFCFHTGAALGRAYGDHPAFAAALMHTEVRGESQVSFHPEEVEAYRQAHDAAIPDEVQNKNGVDYRKLKDFPQNRLIADDNPILQYYRWFWQVGDGWNELNTKLHQGLKSQIDRQDFWTFHDPAVRVPSISGSGGSADVLAHWTYSYPDPIRIGLCTDELFEMARSGGLGQDVMKMTQVIWYRSQTAPENSVSSGPTSPWVDQDPDAAYITISPMHLREAFWWKVARPIQGIMYHGWQSLVPTSSPGAYRFTNPHSQHELQRLVENVVEPLGPSLRQIPDPPADVAFLESFTSQMFARRGTYGWNGSWAGDMYHILMYAQLQPRVLYEESLLKGGLDGVKVLVLADCDVLTESVAQAIVDFQAAGGLVVGDGEVCPAIKPDYVVSRFSRSKQADADHAQLQAAARDLRLWLDPQYTWAVDSSNPNVVTRRRQFGSTDYVFAVNDHRDFGTYVGSYGLVMEDGLPSTTTLSLQRPTGFVYDLLSAREVQPTTAKTGSGLQLPLALGPCAGQLLMVTERPIRELLLSAPSAAQRGESIVVDIAVTDGTQPIDAVLPLEVRIIDPEGAEAEFSGYYGAVGGQQQISIDFAPNDRLGVWEIRARELASGKTTAAYVKLSSETP
ncbi:MAG: LamG domain-containing protein [Planctomycetales bacterium]|nr:LamG domain-containing protein [Planctomycetales bacterium]